MGFHYVVSRRTSTVVPLNFGLATIWLFHCVQFLTCSLRSAGGTLTTYVFILDSIFAINSSYY